MQPLPHYSGPHSDGYIDSEDVVIEESSGWEDEPESKFDILAKDKNLANKIIEMANNHVPLSTILKKHNIKFTKVDSPSGWTMKAPCPFPDHKDRTPSFGYNPGEDRFNCFGCQRGGRSVSFIVYMQGGKHIDVAKILLGDAISEDDLLADYEEQNGSQIQSLLIDASTYFRNFIKKQNYNPAAIEHAENVNWNLQIYLCKNHIPGSIIVNELAARIEKIKKRLDDFGEEE